MNSSMHRTIAAALMLLVVSGQALACRPKYIPLEERVASSSSIHVGYVTGMRFSEAEDSLQSGGSPERIWIPEIVEFRVFVNQTIKGEKKDFVFAESSGCGGEMPGPHSKVVVFIDPDYPPYIAPAEEMLQDVEETLKNVQ